METMMAKASKTAERKRIDSIEQAGLDEENERRGITSRDSIALAREVAISQLRFGHDPDCGMNINARRSDLNPAVAEMTTLIRDQGMFQALVACRGVTGYPTPLYVADGNRRLAALFELYGADSTRTVPLVEVSRERALEISLTAVTSCVPIHAIDQFQTFAALAAAPHNLSVDEIAARFLVAPKFVRQRLALGTLSPKVTSWWREHSAPGPEHRRDADETAMAFTLLQSHKEQDELFGRLMKQSSLYAHSVRERIVGKQADMGKYLSFIGAAAYRAAGGEVIEDLFGTAHRVSDVPLLRKLTDEALEKKCSKLIEDGWAWAAVHSQENAQWYERVVFDHQHTHKWTKAEKAKSGCIVDVDRDGSLSITRGVLKPGARRAPAGTDPADRPARSSGAAADRPKKKKGQISNSLKADLEHTLNRAIKAAIVAATHGDSDLVQLMGQIIAGSIQPERMHYGSQALADRMGALRDAIPAETMLEATLRAFDAKAYFERVDLGLALAAIKEMGGEPLAKPKKGEAVSMAMKLVKYVEWLPPQLRSRHYDSKVLAARRAQGKKNWRDEQAAKAKPGRAK
jgi:ParB family chromosome partitioning protein